MTSKQLIVLTTGILIGAAVVFLAVYALASADAALQVQRGLFVATLLLQLVALGLAFWVRGRFEPGETNRILWTLVLAFLAVRVLAESRLLTLYFDWIPVFIDGSPTLRRVYVDVLRFLYTLSDLFLIAALVVAIRLYRAVGLAFSILPRDLIYIGVVALAAGIVFVVRENMVFTFTATPASVQSYRVIAAALATVVVCLCLIIRRFVLQTGGGVLARVWTAIILAGVARALSFVTIALVSAHATIIAEFVEQAFLWVFASAWLVALSRQRELLSLRIE